MIEFIKENLWVWAGALIVLYTLSGSVQRVGIVISVTAFLLQWVMFLIRRDTE